MTKRLIPILLVASVLAFTPAEAEIKIATIGPMSGPYKLFGEQMRRGAEQAVKDLNDAGGVLNQMVKLIVVDDACRTDLAVRGARDLVDMKVDFVASNYCSKSSIVASKIYTEAHILQISPSSTDPRLTDGGDGNVFRVCGRDDQQSLVAGNFLARTYDKGKVAFLRNDTNSAKAMSDATLKAYRVAGGVPSMVIDYSAGMEDYTALVSQLSMDDIEVVYFAGDDAEAAQMIKAAHMRGYEPQLISSDVLATLRFSEMAGEAGKGMLTTLLHDHRFNPDAASVVDEFRAQSYEPMGYTLYAYGAIQVWAAAVERARSTGFHAIVNVLHSEEFDTAIGKISFDKNGDINGFGYAWYTWTGEKYDFRPDHSWHCCNKNTRRCCP